MPVRPPRVRPRRWSAGGPCRAARPWPGARSAAGRGRLAISAFLGTDGLASALQELEPLVLPHHEAAREGASGPALSSDRNQTSGRASKTGCVHAMSSNAADQEPVFPKNTPPSQLPPGCGCARRSRPWRRAPRGPRHAGSRPARPRRAWASGPHSYATRSVGAGSAAAGPRHPAQARAPRDPDGREREAIQPELARRAAEASPRPAALGCRVM